MATLLGTLSGVQDAGAAGTVPVVLVNAAKPRLINNGFACYCGHPSVAIPGLRAALPLLGPNYGERRQGHVLLRYTDGCTFFTYLEGTADDLYRPS